MRMESSHGLGRICLGIALGLVVLLGSGTCLAQSQELREEWRRPFYHVSDCLDFVSPERNSSLVAIRDENIRLGSAQPASASDIAAVKPQSVAADQIEPQQAGLPNASSDEGGQGGGRPGEPRLCDAIMKAWEASGSWETREFYFDSLHSALVVSFGSKRANGPGQLPNTGKENDAKELNAIGLARLLSLPNLLPPSYFGGLVIKYANIKGPLVLNKLTVAFPVAFTGVSIRSGNYDRSILDKTDYPQALAFNDTHFSKRFQISNSAICGSAIISSARTDAYFGIVGSAFLDEDCDLIPLKREDAKDRQKNEDPNLVFWVRSSSFGGAVEITGADGNPSLLQSFDVDNNIMKELRISNIFFERKSSISNNNFGSIIVERIGFAEKYEIVSNRVEGDVVLKNGVGKNSIVSQKIQRVKDGGTIPSLVVTNNEVGGGIYFEQSEENAHYRDLILTGNRFNLLSQIKLVDSWNGVLDLTSSEFLGHLQLIKAGDPKETKENERKDWKGADSDQVIIEFPFKPPDDDKYCWETASEGAQDIGKISENGDRRSLTVHLDDAKIAVLDWQLRLDCSVLWTGKGMTIGHWGVPNALYRNVGSSEQDCRTPDRMAEDCRTPVRMIEDWRVFLKEPESDALGVIASYLSSHGAYRASRTVSEQAKRLNYAPNSGTTCGPSDYFWDCLMAYEWRRGDLLPDNVMQAATLLFLAPGGYGAAPEKVLFCLLVGVVISYLIYLMYSRYIRISYRYGLRKAFGFLYYLERTYGDEFFDSSVWSPEKIRENLKRADSIINNRHDEFRSNYIQYPDFDEIREEIMKTCAYIEKKTFINQYSNRIDRHLTKMRRARVGTSKVFGFSLFEHEQKPGRFTVFRYSVDAMLPVIDLHAYSRYYPESFLLRAFAVTQHIIGWWWLTVFLASAAIL